VSAGRAVRADVRGSCARRSVHALRRALAGAVLLAFGACSDAGPEGAAGPDGAVRPNVLLIVADDQNAGDLGAYGNAHVATPTLDALAREGTSFDRAYTPEAMCTPSRSSLYTGLDPVRHGAHRNHAYVRDGVRSVPHHFGALGYRVALAGKSHVGPLEAFPFELLPGSRIGPAQTRIDGQLDAIAEVIGDTSRPFFLVVADSRPHSVAGEIGGWPEPLLHDPVDVALPPYLIDTHETRVERAGYYDLITELDGLVARVLADLDASGRARDTIVVFLSDHGAGFPFEKWTNYDAGVRVPLIVRWPGRIAAGARSDALVSVTDLLPTLMDLAGAPAVEGLDGRSFADVLRGRAAGHRDLVFGLHTNVGILNGGLYPIRSVRDARWSYLRNLNADGVFTNNITEEGQAGWGSWVERAASDAHAAERVRSYQHRPAEELYDRARDPFEMTNLASDPAALDVLLRLRAEVDGWMQSQGDRGIAEETLSGEAGADVTGARDDAPAERAP